MNETLIPFTITLIVTIIVVWAVCRSDSNGRRSSGVGRDDRHVGDGLAGTADDNKRLKESERRTADALERAGDQNQRAQQLIKKAKDILGNAQHTDSNK